MKADHSGYDWPDINIEDSETAIIREKARARLALLVLLLVIAGIFGTVAYGVVFDDWRVPAGVGMGAMLGWASTIVEHYFGKTKGYDVDAV